MASYECVKKLRHHPLSVLLVKSIFLQCCIFCVLVFLCVQHINVLIISSICFYLFMSSTISKLKKVSLPHRYENFSNPCPSSVYVCYVWIYVVFVCVYIHIPKHIYKFFNPCEHYLGVQYEAFGDFLLPLTLLQRITLPVSRWDTKPPGFKSLTYLCSLWYD